MLTAGVRQDVARMGVGPLRVNQHPSMMHTSPFRSCDYCGKQTEPSPYRRSVLRRAWVMHPNSRKLSCTSCRRKAEDEDARVAELVKAHGQELKYRLLAEPAGRSIADERGTILSGAMKQYRRIKANYADAVLLFREGDFYYALEDDAEQCSRTLGTVSSMQWVDDELVRLGGFPATALDQYLPRLVRAGHRVAVCDQLAGPPVPGMVSEPFGDVPLRKTHALVIKGVATPVAVHKDGAAYYALDGTWSIGTADSRIKRVVYADRMPASEPTATEVATDALDGSVLYEPTEQYRRIKPLYKDALLILRDHQGYLMLYRDAERAAAVLQVEYTGNGAFRIAKSMLERVLDDLVKANYRVAVVIDPNVDDPRVAKQVDLWDMISTDATVVGEPAEGYGGDHVFALGGEIRLCMVEQPHGTVVEAQVNWLGGTIGDRRTVHVDLRGGRASSETGYRSVFLHLHPDEELTEDHLLELLTTVCEERFAELYPGTDGNQGMLFEPAASYRMGQLIDIHEHAEAWADLMALFRTELQRRYGTDDIQSRNPEYREVWQYMGTVLHTDHAEHQFRHRMHPKTKRREYLHLGMPYAHASMGAFRPAAPTPAPPEPEEAFYPDLDAMGNAYSDADPGL